MNRVTRLHPSRIGPFRQLSAAALVSLFGGLAACDGSPTMPVDVPLDVPTQPVSLVMERLRPVENTVTASGVWVHLAVRVTGLYNRLPMADVPVVWRSTTAAVDFNTSPSPVPSTESLTLATDRNGIAFVLVRYREIGTTKITASLVGSDTDNETFTITTTDPPTYVIDFGPLFDCNETSSFWHHGEDAETLSVPVGAVVDWVYPAWLHPSCTARIESVSVPPGATGFNSGILSPGARFRFIPQAAGTWTYRDSVNGGSATLTVTESQ